MVILLGMFVIIGVSFATTMVVTLDSFANFHKSAITFNTWDTMILGSSNHVAKSSSKFLEAIQQQVDRIINKSGYTYVNQTMTDYEHISYELNEETGEMDPFVEYVINYRLHELVQNYGDLASRNNKPAKINWAEIISDYQSSLSTDLANTIEYGLSPTDTHTQTNSNKGHTYNLTHSDYIDSTADSGGTKYAPTVLSGETSESTNSNFNTETLGSTTLYINDDIIHQLFPENSDLVINIIKANSDVFGISFSDDPSVLSMNNIPDGVEVQVSYDDPVNNYDNSHGHGHGHEDTSSEPHT